MGLWGSLLLPALIWWIIINTIICPQGELYEHYNNYRRWHTFVPGRYLWFSDEKILLRQTYVYLCSFPHQNLSPSTIFKLYIFSSIFLFSGLSYVLLGKILRVHNPEVRNMTKNLYIYIYLLDTITELKLIQHIYLDMIYLDCAYSLWFYHLV